MSEEKLYTQKELDVALQMAKREVLEKVAQYYDYDTKTLDFKALQDSIIEPE